MKRSQRSARKLSAERSTVWKSMPACSEQVTRQMILILHHWKVFLEEHPATHSGTEGGSKHKCASRGLLLTCGPALPGLLSPHHGRIFPWKLHAAPEGCNPAGDAHHQHGRCSTNVLLINQQRRGEGRLQHSAGRQEPSLLYLRQPHAPTGTTRLHRRVAPHAAAGRGSDRRRAGGERRGEAEAPGIPPAAPPNPR